MPISLTRKKSIFREEKIYEDKKEEFVILTLHTKISDIFTIFEFF